MDQWVVHKFGGTSVGDANCMRKCADIIKPLLTTGPHSRVAVVVSAMGGKPKVTDLLLDSVHAAARGEEATMSQKLLNDILIKHKSCVNDILHKSPLVAQVILDKISNDIRDINDLLRAVALMKMSHEQILELVSGYGELWSANIMAEFMKQENLPFVFLNARDVLIVSEEDSLGTKVHWEISEEKLNHFIHHGEGKNKHLVITGYIATSLTGVATTLKRDGSDFSASIFGKLLKAKSITIWTDVSGVYSADPRKVPDAQIIPEVSYTEAIELAYFGAKVIHPKTMNPAILDSIPIYIRNTFEPNHPGTRIYVSPAKGQLVREKCVCGFSTVDNITLINIEGTGLIGVPGMAHRLFGALKSANISVMFIAQASSEHSICCAIKDIHSSQARKSIEEAFFYELKQGMVSKVSSIDNCSIIAAVGESMSNMPGVSGIFFGALGKAKINVLSVAQGCDERNISAVVPGADASRALRAVHAAFWLSAIEISIGIIGTGRVGSAVLQTLLDQIDILSERFSLNIKIRAIANSTKMLLGNDLKDEVKGQLHTFYNARHSGSNDHSSSGNNNTASNSMNHDAGGDGNNSTNGNTTVKRGMKRSHSDSLLDVGKLMNGNNTTTSGATTTEAGVTVTTKNNSAVSSFTKVPTNLELLLQQMTINSDTPNAILIDCTNSDAVSLLHPLWLKSGAHVVTSSKRGISGLFDLYSAISQAVLSSNRMYMSEVTIGASLPIRTTLQDILYSGDAVHSIVGLMSVSVGNVITDICENNMTFSAALQKTYDTGLFEDDVFVDLEGTEAAQKLLIIARELGYTLNLSDIEIEPLAHRRQVADWSNIENNNIFETENILLAERARIAKEKGCTLRYVQRINCFPPVELVNPESMRLKPRASVRLEEVPLTSSYAAVKGAVYYFAFHTERYSQHPLIVQGPLSDAANTASGIVGDILRIAKSLGAKDHGPIQRNSSNNSSNGNTRAGSNNNSSNTLVSAGIAGVAVGGK